MKIPDTARPVSAALAWAESAFVLGIGFEMERHGAENSTAVDAGVAERNSKLENGNLLDEDKQSPHPLEDEGGAPGTRQIARLLKN